MRDTKTHHSLLQKNKNKITQTNKTNLLNSHTQQKKNDIKYTKMSDIG